MKTALNFFNRILKEYPLQFILLVFLIILLGFSDLVGISIIVPLLNLVFLKEGGKQEESLDKVSIIFGQIADKFGISLDLTVVLFFIMFVFTAQSTLKFGVDIFIAKLHVLFLKDLSKALYHNYFKSTWPFFYKNKLGELVNPVITETDRAASALQFFGKLLAEIFTAVLYVILVIAISWELALGAFIFGILASFLSRSIMTRSESYGIATTDVNAKTQSMVVDFLTLAKIIKSSSTENSAIKKLDKIVMERLQLRFKSLFNASLVPFIFTPLSIGVICLVIYISITFLSLDFAMVVLLLALFYRLMPKILTIQSTFQLFLTFAPGLTNIDKQINIAKSYNEKNGKLIFNSLSDSIRLVDVNFSYDKNITDLTLEKININIKKGGITALVGGSGGGKSTISDICLGLITPNSGTILVDDKPLEDLDKNSYRRKVGYVTQDAQLFNDSVKNNIAWARPEATLSEIESATKQAFAHDFILELPNKYNTQLGDRGVRISGGQRQRICLARAILQNPEILILDEATSALDAESEKKIHDAVTKLRGNVTILIIAHRLATVKTADIVYVIENGKILEEGSWATLVNSGTRFEQLRSLQNLD